MATTTNYGWTTPDDTALVKDGAAAIRTLGSSVDTTTKALNPSTTLGDIEYRSSTANTNTRLGIGTTGQVLSVSGGVPAWADASGGGYTLLSTTTLSSTATTISSIPTTYSALLLIGENVGISNNNYSMAITINATTSGYSNNYNFVQSGGFTDIQSTTSFRINNFGNTNVDVFTMEIFRAKETTGNKIARYWASTKGNGAIGLGTGSVPISAAITSLTLTAASGNLSGTVYLLGV